MGTFFSVYHGIPKNLSYYVILCRYMMICVGGNMMKDDDSPVLISGQPEFAGCQFISLRQGIMLPFVGTM